MIDSMQWTRVLSRCGVRLATALAWSQAFADHVQPQDFSTGRGELPDFVGQVLHETELLEHVEEDLSYSAPRLCEVWPARFPTIEAATPYAHNPQALAERTYGGRMGNAKLGDGWRYRGRGVPMVTGFANYQLLAEVSGLPLLDQPDLLSSPDCAMRCGVLWWERKVPDSAIGNVEAVTKAVQGGELGLFDRATLTAKAKAALDEIQSQQPGASAA